MADDKTEVGGGPRPLRSGRDLKELIDSDIIVSINRRMKVGKGAIPKKEVQDTYYGNLNGAHDIIDAENGEMDFTIIHFNGMPSVTIEWSIKGQSVMYQVV